VLAEREPNQQAVGHEELSSSDIVPNRPSLSVPASIVTVVPHPWHDHRAGPAGRARGGETRHYGHVAAYVRVGRRTRGRDVVVIGVPSSSRSPWVSWGIGECTTKHDP